LPIVCPRCDSADMIAKVSAIVSAGTVHGEQISRIGTNALYQPVYGSPDFKSAQSELASKLAAPSWPGQLMKTGWGCAGTLIAFSIGLTVVICLGGAYALDHEVKSWPVAIGYLVVDVLLILAAFSRTRRQREALEYNSKEGRRADKRHAEMLRNWEALWYCSRDDIVFREDVNSSYVPLSRVNEMY